MRVQTAGAAKPGRGGRALIDFKKNWQYLLLCLPSMIGYVFFHFVPLAGIIMPFTKYTYRDGIFGSKWVWFKNFTTLFRSPVFGRLIRNTVLYSVSFTIIGHAMAIFTALMLYELAGKRLKKLYQTSMMIPNFMSWGHRGLCHLRHTASLLRLYPSAARCDESALLRLLYRSHMVAVDPDADQYVEGHERLSDLLRLPDGR